MAYSLRPDGLSDVHLPDGTVMPMALSSQELQAMGHTEITDSAQRPAGPDSRVAGPGGGDPRDLASGAGVFGAPPTQREQIDQFRAAVDKTVPQSHESSEPRSKFDVSTAAGRGPSGAPELAAHREAPAPAERGSTGSQMSPEEEAVFREALSGGGGGPVRNQTYVKDQKVKQTVYGQVPGELSADIAARGADLEQTQNDNLTDRTADRSQLLQRRDADLTRQMDDVIDQRVKRQQVDQKLAAYQSARDQQQAEVASMKAPDMHGYWKEKGIASQIMTGISIALGGYLQGLRGGENPGLTMANQAIDRWMTSEKEKYDRKKGAFNEADNQYAKALALYGTPEQAEHEMRNQAYSVRDAMLANQLDQIGNADAFAKGQELLKASALERQQANAKGYQMAGEQAVETTYGTRQVGGGKKPSLLDAYEAAGKVKKVTDFLNGKTDVNGKPIAGAAASPLAVRFPDGSVKLAGSSREKAQSQKVVRSAWGGINDVDRLIQLTDGASSREWGSDERGEAEALAASLLLKVHDAHGIATFQQATSDLMHEMIGDATKFARNPNAVSKLKGVRRGLEDAIHEQRKFLAPAGGGAGGEAAEEADNDLPDSAQEVVE